MGWNTVVLSQYTLSNINELNGLWLKYSVLWWAFPGVAGEIVGYFYNLVTSIKIDNKQSDTKNIVTKKFITQAFFTSRDHSLQTVAERHKYALSTLSACWPYVQHG